MKRNTEYIDLTGEAPSRYNESLVDRLEYCRSMLRVHGLITEKNDSEIGDELAERRRVAEEEHVWFVESEESEDL